jgi:hypothetical protein
MTDTVTSDFVTVSNNILQQRYVISPPVNFPPVASVSTPGLVGGLLIGNQEKRGAYAIVIEHRKSSIKLAAEPVIESYREQSLPH